MKVKLDKLHRFVVEGDTLKIFGGRGRKSAISIFADSEKNTEALEKLEKAGMSPQLLAAKLDIEDETICAEVYGLFEHKIEELRELTMKRGISRGVARCAVARRFKKERQRRLYRFAKEFTRENGKEISRRTGAEIAKCRKLVQIGSTIQEKTPDIIAEMYVEKRVIPEINVMRREQDAA